MSLKNKIVTIRATQTALDVSLQLTGSVDFVIELIERNSEMENLEKDLTGLEIEYDITGNFVQNFYISKSETVGTKPSYKNKNGACLLTGKGNRLVQYNTYRILI